MSRSVSTVLFHGQRPWNSTVLMMHGNSNIKVWTISLWRNVKGIVTRVNDSFLMIFKDSELFLAGKIEYWIDTKICFNRRKCNEDAKDSGSRWWWSYIFIFSWTSLQHRISAFHLFSPVPERYCREIVALLPLHEVPDWNIVPPSDHRDWLPLATAHIVLALDAV